MSTGVVISLILGGIVIIILISLLLTGVLWPSKSFATDCKFSCVEKSFCKEPLESSYNQKCSQNPSYICCKQTDPKAYEKSTNYLAEGESQTTSYGETQHKTTVKKIDEKNVILEIESTPKTITISYSQWTELVLDDGKYKVKAEKQVFNGVAKVSVYLYKDVTSVSEQIEQAVITVDFVKTKAGTTGSQEMAENQQKINLSTDESILFKISIKNPKNGCVAYITKDGQIVSNSNDKQLRTVQDNKGCEYFTLLLDPELANLEEGLLNLDVIAFNNEQDCGAGELGVSSAGCWNSSVKISIQLGKSSWSFDPCPLNQLIIDDLIDPADYCACGEHIIGVYSGYSCIDKNGVLMPEKQDVLLCPQNLEITSHLLYISDACLCGAETITADENKICTYSQTSSTYSSRLCSEISCADYCTFNSESAVCDSFENQICQKDPCSSAAEGKSCIIENNLCIEGDETQNVQQTQDSQETPQSQESQEESIIWGQLHCTQVASCEEYCEPGSSIKQCTSAEDGTACKNDVCNVAPAGKSCGFQYTNNANLNMGYCGIACPTYTKIPSNYPDCVCGYGTKIDSGSSTICVESPTSTGGLKKIDCSSLVENYCQNYCNKNADDGVCDQIEQEMCNQDVCGFDSQGCIFKESYCKSRVTPDCPTSATITETCICGSEQIEPGTGYVCLNPVFGLTQKTKTECDFDSTKNYPTGYQCSDYCDLANEYYDEAKCDSNEIGLCNHDACGFGGQAGCVRLDTDGNGGYDECGSQ